MRLSIVIPAYNEASRLPATLEVLKKLIDDRALQWTIGEVLVVNDGSTDGTKEYIEKISKQWTLIRPMSLSENQGKGAAVHKGLRESREEFVLIADADMATPWSEMNKFLPDVAQYDLLMGSRALPQSEIVVRQHWVRQNMGRTFNKILKGIVGLKFHDTQCGFKLVKISDVVRTKVLPQLRVNRFAWDVELILLMQDEKLQIKEVPVRWEHKEESHVRLFRDSWEMLFTVLKLRLGL